MDLLRGLQQIHPGWLAPLDKAAGAAFGLGLWSFLLPKTTRSGGLNTQKIKFDEANDQFFTNGGEFCLPPEPGCHLSFPC